MPWPSNLDWLRHTLTDLPERKVDDALDDTLRNDIDFEAMSDPANPKCSEMRRRYHVQESREDLRDLE